MKMWSIYCVVSINAINSIPLYHSGRFTHYAACGTMVLAKRVPDTKLLMEDKKHVVYFDTPQECLELVDWYLAHEGEHQKIADAGMERSHTCFSPVKIASDILDVIKIEVINLIDVLLHVNFKNYEIFF